MTVQLERIDDQPDRQVGNAVATAERPHGLKYNLFYGRGGKRIVGYDNERGKDNHKHVGEVQTRYRFVSTEKMVADFLGDVDRLRGEHDE